MPIITIIERIYQYIQVLETQLLPQLKEWFPRDGECIFMPNLAPWHKERSDKNTAVLPFPGNSPDLNTVENMGSSPPRAS